MSLEMTKVRHLLIAAGALLALAACEKKDVVAIVGSARITHADLSAAGPVKSGPEARARLDAIVARELLAEAARDAKLNAQPEIASRVRAAQREILAQAYTDTQLAKFGDEESLRELYAKKKDSLQRKQIHVRHIVVRHPEGKGRDGELVAQAKMNEAYAKLLGGEDFAKLAREISEDSVSAANGGDLGKLTEGQVDATFFANAASLKRNEVSKPFATALGWHVVQALEDPQVSVPSFEEVRGRLASEARMDAHRELLERLRRDTNVRIYEDRLVSDVKQEGP